MLKSRGLSVLVFSFAATALAIAQTPPPPPGTVDINLTTNAAPASPPAPKEAPGTAHVSGTYTTNVGWSPKTAVFHTSYNGQAAVPHDALSMLNGKYGATGTDAKGNTIIVPKDYSLGRGSYTGWVEVEYIDIKVMPVGTVTKKVKSSVVAFGI